MDRLKEMRKQKGLSQKDVCEVLKIRQSTYSRYETGDIKLDPDTLIKLSELFDISIDYLVGNTDVPMTLDEVRFNDEVDDMSDEEILAKYDLNFDGKPLTEREALLILQVIRSLDK